MMSGLPRPAIFGSASVAPASASAFISGSGLISLLSGMKPETMVPGETASGNARAAIASAAALRASAGSASRRATASRRRAAFSDSIDGAVVDTFVSRMRRSVKRCTAKPGSSQPETIPVLRRTRSHTL